MLDRYFDNAATTPIDPRVLAEMMPFLGVECGNANSIHGFGQRARAAVEMARQRVADLLGAEDPSQILFTSGATESNNQVLNWAETGAVGPFEHSAVREPARRLGFQVLTNDGLLTKKPASKVTFLSHMLVNNEVGTIWDLEPFRGSTEALHSDITQAVGKVPIDLSQVDYASFSGHKLYAPKGVGGLYFKSFPPAALLQGGEQEGGSRGGTLNVPGIVGMGCAAAIAEQEQGDQTLLATELRAIVLDGLGACSDWQTNGGSHVSPYILSVSFLGLEGESLVIEADQAGYAISSGAACSSQSTEPSHVLQALKIDEEWARGTVRISFGRFCTSQAAAGLAKALRQAVEKLRRMN